VPTETHADCNKKYNLIYYTVKPQAVLTFSVCPNGALYTKLREKIQYKWSSAFIGLCLQYLSVFPVCADWLILIDLWHPNWKAARNIIGILAGSLSPREPARRLLLLKIYYTHAWNNQLVYILYDGRSALGIADLIKVSV
jgi:hypothetical protein